MKTITLFFLIFLFGKLIMNFFVFKYLKKYFDFNEQRANAENKVFKPFIGMELSLFKGLLERFTIYFCLVINLSQILIVFGALKIGTRLDKTKEITNDYFLVGNFISILTSAIYYYAYDTLSR